MHRPSTKFNHEQFHSPHNTKFLPLENNPILYNQESLSTPFGTSPSIGSFGPSMVDGGEVESIGCDGGVIGQPATTE